MQKIKEETEIFRNRKTLFSEGGYVTQTVLLLTEGTLEHGNHGGGKKKGK